uniref:Uncharacterized protein n=1 Tax=Trichogramma kaykai TaxID=54128 RepID=A0ABD2WGT8_9HYME
MQLQIFKSPVLPEPDPKSFPIPPSDSENSVESDQESESENEQQNEPIDATSAQPSEKSNSTTNNKIVYSKGLMHCMDGNIAYFIDDQGQPVDEGARKLHEFNKLPKFSNISIGEVSFEVNKRLLEDIVVFRKPITGLNVYITGKISKTTSNAESNNAWIAS